MGTVTNTTPFRLGSEHGTAVSRGGSRIRFFYGRVTPSATYATGGETVGGLPTGYGSLRAVFITPGHDGTRHWSWDGSTSTPKLKAYDAFATEEGAGTDVSTAVLNLILVYEQ